MGPGSLSDTAAVSHHENDFTLAFAKLIPLPGDRRLEEARCRVFQFLRTPPSQNYRQRRILYRNRMPACRILAIN
jgi:hypothetical protein